MNLFMYKKSQSLSLEIIVVVVLVLTVSIFLISYQSFQVEEGEVASKSQQEILNEDLQKLEQGLIDNDIIDNLENVNIYSLQAFDIDNLRQNLGINGEVVIYFEKEGNLVKIDTNKTCVGDLDIEINGYKCSN